MPLYEYVCEKTGDVIELIRPMANADDPVEDPERKGRVFKRKLSTFAAKSASGLPASGGHVHTGNCCCGRGGACGMN
ncbi:MAG: zinc ribbon domain-containing protein [Phycisphaeraceae bacterium]|nr:MAG: zinc ribbon domain-containing protein [Phycisphaeraceae bacterium]